MRVFKKKRNSALREMHRDPGFPALSGSTYRHVLNALEAQLSPDFYLEIGSRSGTSLKDRKCSFAAIDPEFRLDGKVLNDAPIQMFFQLTSDAFFDEGHVSRTGTLPKLSFIDGMHLIDYVLRDFRNVEANSDPEGVICLHDIVPFNVEMTSRDVSSLERITAWTGDVWKIIPILQSFRPDLILEVVGAPKTGILVVRNIDPENRILFEKGDQILNTFLELDLADYGPETFFGEFELLDPDRYIASLW